MKFSVPNQPEGVPPAGIQKSEKIRLIAMGLGLLLLIGLFAFSKFQGAKMSAEENAEQEGLLPGGVDDDEVQVVVALPDIDATKIADVVHDEDGAERVVLEPMLVDLMTPWARVLTERHFEELGVEALDADGIEKLVEAREERRGDAFRVWGGVESIRKRRFGSNDKEHYLLRVVTDDGGRAYFLAPNLPDGYASVGAYLRFDGLFAKVYSDEAESDWVDGPLLVGPRPVISYPSQGEIPSLTGLLEGVTDDEIDNTTGIPFTGRWVTMGHAVSEAAEELDWDSVPELDATLIGDIAQNGEKYRGQPFRIPVSQLVGFTALDAGENPARIERITDGWIGNTTWKNILRYQTPFETEPLQRRDLVSAKGFFLKNHAYEPRDGGLNKAPFFILHSIEKVEPEVDASVKVIIQGLAALTIAMILGFAYLLMRDKRRSQQLQEDLVRRRRERRARAAQPQ